MKDPTNHSIREPAASRSAGHLLVVDDEPGIRSTLLGILSDEGYRVETAATAAEARTRLATAAFDLVLLDVWLPDADGLDFLEKLHTGEDPPAVVVISGHGSVEAAVRAIKLGADDFLEKPLALERVLLTVRNALDRSRLRREVDRLAERVGDGPLVGSGAAIQELRAQIATAAASSARVLILGENGTGKELVARELHRLSPRAAGPFVAVNCAAIPHELIESELFGHTRGAFTGAVSDRPGRFEQADGGTLFLDEVADMAPAAQAKVLRVLEEQRFERVGGRTTLESDARVLAATNQDLQAAVAAGRFREDLYYRLAVIPLRVPALRERSEDIPELAMYFLTRFGPAKRLTPGALARLREHSWPGNVRELRNLVERLAIMIPGPEIQEAAVATALASTAAAPAATPVATSHTHRELREARDNWERDYLRQAVDAAGGNLARAARELGIERSNLYRKLKTYGVEVKRPP